MASRRAQAPFAVVTGALGLAGALVGQKIVNASWRRVTGTEPPNLEDPEVPLGRATCWVLVSGTSQAVLQLALGRLVSAGAARLAARSAWIQRIR